MMRMGFRDAYCSLRRSYKCDCQKRELDPNQDEYVDEIINRMTLSELMNELACIAEFEDGIDGR